MPCHSPGKTHARFAGPGHLPSAHGALGLLMWCVGSKPRESQSFSPELTTSSSLELLMSFSALDNNLALNYRSRACYQLQWPLYPSYSQRGKALGAGRAKHLCLPLLELESPHQEPGTHRSSQMGRGWRCLTPPSLGVSGSASLTSHSFQWV